LAPTPSAVTLDIMHWNRLRENLESVRGRIAEAARRAGRDPGAVTLVAVTKRNPPELIRPLVDSGAHDLGENYPQELWKKAEALGDAPVRWHLIGHLQSNKARKTLPMVRMVHAVDSLKLLQTLDSLVTDLDLADPPTVCLQVNTSGEASKHGWSPREIALDADAIAACRHIPVVGLMTMAALDASPQSARASFARLRAVRDALRPRTGLALDQLSMGMSGDFVEAVEEGATLVRVGSALFEGVAP
jgi:pyridoxal phosphate enzyme (YggS family)